MNTNLGHPILGQNAAFRGTYERSVLVTGVYPKAEEGDFWYVLPAIGDALEYLVCKSNSEGDKSHFDQFSIEENRSQSQCPHCGRGISLCK